MKNRYIPFGYQMTNGVIETNQTEVDAVKFIFHEYLGRASLKTISEALTDLGVAYIEGKSEWNKSRIKRILEDDQYVGNGIYPQIISAGDFSIAQEQKISRRNHVNPTSENLLFLQKFSVCHNCGQKIVHRKNTRYEKLDNWRCESDECVKTVRIADNALLSTITAMFNRLIASPELAEPGVPISETPSLEVKRLTNEINRQLERKDFDKDELKNMILNCAAEKYNDIKSVRHITDTLKVDFEKSSPLSTFNKELFERTISHIRFTQSGEIFLELKNGKIIGKEQNI